MAKKKKKRGKFKTLLYIVLCTLFILFLFLMLGAYVFKTGISTIIVKGNNILSDDEIIEISSLGDYPNFYLFSTSDVSSLLKQNQFIKDVSVKKKLFFEVEINVTEYKPLFIREDTDRIVFETGKEIINDDKYELNVPFLVNYVPDTKYEKFIEKMIEIDDSIINKISDIKYYPNKYDEERFVLYMNDSNRVYINLPKFRSLNKYNEMVTKFEGKTGVLYLDSGNYFEIDKKK